MDAFLIIFFFLFASLMYALVQEINKQRKTYRKKNKQRQQNNRINSQTFSGLEKKLLLMLGGDRNAALRLVSAARQKKPGQTEFWYWEKVIRDLERDRR